MREEHRGLVLTVDDNEVLRYSITRMLMDAGFEVIEASNGRDGLKMASRLPDLITLDVNLPDLNGFEVCRELKSNPQTKHIPVLHISGTFVDPEYRVKGLQGGADGYLAEPFDRSELVATVEALLRLKSAEKDAVKKLKIADSAQETMRQANVNLDAEVKERTLEIQRQSEEIRKLNVDLMRLQDEERRRISRELHDSTGQLLALLTINTSKLLNPKTDAGLSEPARKIVSESAEILAELNNQLRTVTYLLHPPLLDEIGLASTLAWYVEGFTERSHIQVALNISEDFGRLDQGMEIGLFRIVQECLTNVHKHSGSKTAFVQLLRTPNLIQLDVKDAGTKFAAANSVFKRGTGLLGMGERVRQMGGELTASSGPAGAHIHVEIPVSSVQPEQNS